MTRDTQAIDALIEAVKRGDHVAVQIHAKRMASNARDIGAFFPSHEIEKAMSRNDMNAAIALLSELLPGRKWCRQWDGSMWVHSTEGTKYIYGVCETPARALLLATLKAWRDME